MSLSESKWVWLRLSEAEWVRECQRMVRIGKCCYMIEIGDTAVNIVRNCIPMRNCMQGSAYGLKAISDWFFSIHFFKFFFCLINSNFLKNCCISSTFKNRRHFHLIWLKCTVNLGGHSMLEVRPIYWWRPKRTLSNRWFASKEPIPIGCSHRKKG